MIIIIIIIIIIRLSTSVEVDLFCGHLELKSDFLQIPITTTPGMFVVVVSDAVPENVVVINDPVPKSVVVVNDPVTESVVVVNESKTVNKVDELCRFIIPVKSFNDLIITVE